VRSTTRSEYEEQETLGLALSAHPRLKGSARYPRERIVPPFLLLHYSSEVVNQPRLRTWAPSNSDTCMALALNNAQRLISPRARSGTREMGAAVLGLLARALRRFFAGYVPRGMTAGRRAQAPIRARSPAARMSLSACTKFLPVRRRSAAPPLRTAEVSEMPGFIGRSGEI
jgi:hypothetical protein